MTSTSTKYEDLAQRLATGLAGAAIGIFCIAYSQWTCALCFLFLLVMTQWEFYTLLRKFGRKPLKYSGTALGVALYAIVYFVESGYLDQNSYFLLFISIPIIYLNKLYDPFDKDKLINIAYTFFGVIYIALPISLIHVLGFSEGTYHYEFVLGLMLMLWASDVGAYFAGRTFGRRKLFERISPGKTWEGSIGGLVLSLVFAIGMYYFHSSLQLWQWLLFCIAIVVFGAYGDLIESMFKRSMSLKDSGSKLPGHGGFLDRFDGLLIAVPVLVVLFKVIFFNSK